MENEKVTYLSDFKQSKQKKERKMLLMVIIIGIVVGLICWRYFIENMAQLDIDFPESKNITYNSQRPIAATATSIANEFEQNDGKPILLYLYTSWCSACKHNFEIFNEIAREFQNTQLHVIALAIDRDIDDTALQTYLNEQGDLYFQPRYLAFKEGFKEFLKQKNIAYEGRIPFTVLINRDGQIVAKYVGVKSKNYLRNRIIKELR